MRRWLGALFLIASGVEILLLVLAGKWLGGTALFTWIVLTGFLGGYMARREGQRVWQDAQYRMSRGEVPAGSLLDGLCIFIGGMLLIAPGLLADLAGLILLLPLTRPMAKLLLLRLIHKQIAKGRSSMYWRP